MAEVLEAAAATIRKQQQIAGEMLEKGADVTSEAAVTADAVRDAESRPGLSAGTGVGRLPARGCTPPPAR